MKIYNVIVEDRHTDVNVIPFKDKDDAIGEAEKIATDNSSGFYPYKDDLIQDYDNGIILLLTYSCEGDCVSVFETELVE